MKYIKRFLSIVLVFSVLFYSSGLSVHASEITDEDDKQYDYIMSLEGPSVLFEGNLTKNSDGNFVGTLRSGWSTISCVLSGDTAGVSRLYKVYIRWTGHNAIQAIKAKNITIKNANILSSDEPYFDRPFFIQGLSSASGYKDIGTCYIDDNVKNVKVKTEGLMVALYDDNEFVFMSTGEISGNIRL